MLVAPHSAAFPHPPPTRRYREEAQSASAPTMQLPRTLARPAFTDVSRDALAMAAPDLAAVPIEFIRNGLRNTLPQMQAGIAALAPSHLPQSVPKSHLPPTLTVPLRATSSAHPSYPTHALAISPASSKGHRSSSAETASLFPVHAVVLVAHCAKLPRLPPPAQPATRNTATLPVLPLALPSPQAFTILHPYMYTHRLDAVLATLLPLPPSFLETLAPAAPGNDNTPHARVVAALASRSALHRLASHLDAAAGRSLSALMAHAGHVKELWQDMVALGLYDPELWDALDLAWEVVLGALNLAAAQ